MYDFDFDSYDFNAPYVQQQQNNPDAEQTQDPLQSSHGVPAQPEFNQDTIDDFFRLSEEEQNNFGELNNDQQAAIEAPISRLSTEVDGQSNVILPNGTIAEFIASMNRETAGTNAETPPKQTLDGEVLQMSNSDVVVDPIQEAAASNHGLLTNPPWRQSFAALPSNTIGSSQFPFVGAQEPRIQVLGGEYPPTERFMSRDESFAQPSAFADLPRPLDSGSRPASRVKKTARHMARRQKPSTSEFWQTHTTITHPDLRIRCRGTFGELLERYPELEATITMQCAKWKLSTPEKYRKTTARRKKASQRLPQYAVQAIGNVDHAAGMVMGAGVQQTIVSPFQMPVDGPAQSPSALNTSGLQVHSPTVSIPNSAPAVIVQQIAVGTTAEAFDLEHESIDAALEYIERPTTDVCERLNIESDDWEDLSDFSAEFRFLCQRLFDALQHPGGDVPGHFDDQQGQNYTKNHEKVYAVVLELMETREQIREAKARVIKAMHEVVRVHEVGIPKTVLTTRNKASGYEIDKESTCRQRAQKVIDNTRACKYIALDVLKSKNLADFARSPDQYLLKKYGNSRGNKNQGDHLKDMRALRKGQKTANEVLGGRGASAYTQMGSAASTPVPNGLPPQYNPLGQVTDTQQSSMYLTPHSYGFHSPECQGEHSLPRHPLQSGGSGTKSGRKHGTDDGQDQDDLGDVDRYGKRAETHDSRRRYWGNENAGS